MSTNIRTIASETTLDFAKTEIIDNGVAPADGATDLVVVIHLKNSNNTPVVDFLPTYEVASGSGVTAAPCTRSDSNGASICLLKSTQIGSKQIRLTNARVGLTHTVSFSTPARNGQGVEFVAASEQKATSSGGYKGQVTVGSTLQGINVTTSGGYSGKMSMQGVLASQ